jgi:hypothetical protein
MDKKEISAYLRGGGTLISKGINKEGEPVILQTDKHAAGRIRLTFTNEQFRYYALNVLSKHPQITVYE